MELNDTTRLIIGAAMDVHSALGPGLLESTYEACLVHELVARGARVERQKALPVTYKGLRLDCGYRIDVVVECQVVVELKSVARFEPVHEAQVLSYLRLSGYPVGLLLNFNVRHMRNGIRRLVGSNFRQSSVSSVSSVVNAGTL